MRRRGVVFSSMTQIFIDERNSRARIVLGVGGKARCSAVRPRDGTAIRICATAYQQNFPEEGLGAIKVLQSYICSNECSLFLCRPNATTPASTSKHPIAISPIANGIIDVSNERQPRALDTRRFSDSKSDGQEENGEPVRWLD
jgi:hypothetical protein